MNVVRVLDCVIFERLKGGGKNQKMEWGDKGQTRSSVENPQVEASNQHHTHFDHEICTTVRCFIKLGDFFICQSSLSIQGKK